MRKLAIAAAFAAAASIASAGSLDDPERDPEVETLIAPPPVEEPSKGGLTLLQLLLLVALGLVIEK